MRKLFLDSRYFVKTKRIRPGLTWPRVLPQCTDTSTLNVAPFRRYAMLIAQETGCRRTQGWDGIVDLNVGGGTEYVYLVWKESP